MEITNVGGIYKGSATIEEGVNAVQASNWQGKSSLIAAIEAVMGTATTLTEGRSRGRVILDGEQRYDVELRREGEEIAVDGELFLTEAHDRACAELFAFLDDSNPVRRAVREGQNLGDVLTRPLDFEDIDVRIAGLKSDRDAIERELERAREDARRLPRLTEAVTNLESDVEELEERRDALRDEVGANGRTDELSEFKAERTQVADMIERLESAIERTGAKLSERYEELESIVVRDGDVADEVAETRESIRETERNVDLLRSVYSAHQRLLETDRVGLVSDVDHGVLDDEHTCWTCGANTDRVAIEEQLEGLGNRIRELEGNLAGSREHLAEIERRREEIEETRRRKRNLEGEISNLESTLTDREESLASARGRLEEIEERIDGLADVDAAATEALTDVESEIKYRENELAEAADERDACAASAQREEPLESELANVNGEIEALRNRKETVRRETRDAFDRALSDVLDRFDTGFENARLTADFELEIARNGRAVEWSALSEGELELLGFVAALAGHETFEVSETVPFMLLDRLGGLADENLHRLVEYLSDRTRYLVLTAYPENAPFEGRTIDPTSWTVVSPEQEATA